MQGQWLSTKPVWLISSCQWGDESGHCCCHTHRYSAAVSRPANEFFHSLLVCVEYWLGSDLAWILHLSSVFLIHTQFIQHLLHPWMTGSSRLCRPVGQLKLLLICPRATVYYQPRWGGGERERNILKWKYKPWSLGKNQRCQVWINNYS